MSGPKLVRVVTREEVIATSQRELARLDDALATWMSTCEAQGLAQPDELAKTRETVQKIHQLLAAEKFVELQKQAPREIAFLSKDLEDRRSRLAERRARALISRRRLATVAATLIVALEKSDTEVPDDLLEDLRKSRDTSASRTEDIEAVLSQAFSLLTSASQSSSTNDRQRELARQLGKGEETATLVDWLVKRPPAGDERAKDIDQRIAQLEAMEGAEAALPFIGRANEIASDPSAKRRSLLADSLLMDLAERVAVSKQVASQKATISGLIAQLMQIDPTHVSVGQAKRFMTTFDAGKAETITAGLNSALEEAQEAQSAEMAQVRRRAVLDALSGLGYEIREGMQTAWAENGSVSLRNADRPGYGVKLSGGLSGGPVQFRPVAFAQPGVERNRQRDLDMEALWCSDYERLGASFAHAGGDLKVERDTPVGQIELEVVREEAERDRVRDVVKPKARGAG